MARVQLLERSVAERIAAGEVVERPSSVIKELVENSLDAGAKRITVELQAGGLTRLRVVDDGHGMSADDVRLAIERFATSKIREWEDLDSLATLGFRGEALPSIAAVARLEILTCEPGAEAGTELLVQGCEVQKFGPAPGIPGTRITVSELFFNTPARRKFLKSPAAETSQVVDLLGRLALISPGVQFQVTSNGREALLMTGQMDARQRLARLWKIPAEDFIEVSGETAGLAVSGYVALPQHARSNRTAQTFSVNGRVIKSQTLSQALIEGFSPLLPRGRFPVALLELRLDPSQIDVNVHPTKLEVRFTDQRLPFRAVFRAVGSALERAGADTVRMEDWEAVGKELPAEPAGGWNPVREQGHLAWEVPSAGVWMGPSDPDGEQVFAMDGAARQGDGDGGGDVANGRARSGDGGRGEEQAGSSDAHHSGGGNDAGQLGLGDAGHGHTGDAAQPGNGDASHGSGYHQSDDGSGLGRDLSGRAGHVDVGETGGFGPDGRGEVGRTPGGGGAASESDGDPRPGPAPRHSGYPGGAPTGYPSRPAASTSRSGAIPPTSWSPPASPAARPSTAAVLEAMRPLQVGGSVKILAQLHRTYIVAEVDGELWLVDQHTAHERIWYERLDRLNPLKGCGQGLLVPEVLELAPAAAAFLDGHLEALEDLGFEVEHFGGTAFQLRSLPMGLKPGQGSRVLRDVVEEAASGLFSLAGDARERIREKLRAMVSCKSAVKAGDLLQPAEMHALIDEMLKVEHSLYCPHGRPTRVKLDQRALERLFHRA